ncbi:TetR/AcrR family transcriptional regulator [Terrarubrum flagellatum]|uniref:TetR/AcrR family transcriptional regulator n=1 Tax=Terrirubrum flagellatum TaxID=2895980 RepID=UPI00314549E9
MSVRARVSPEETRCRIMAVAEGLFRRIGYAKTAVADIAAELGMSPANVYRFFPSKGAINDAICRRLCEESEEQARKVLASPLSAPDKLRATVIGLHEHHKGLLNDEKRIHDMVEVAMNESWESIEAHCDRFKQYFAEIAAEGVAAGDFDPDINTEIAGKMIFAACAGLFHPTLIAQFERKKEKPDPNAMVDFLLRALRPSR